MSQAGKKRSNIRSKARKPRRPFPYDRVARMWKQGKTIKSIAHAIGRVDKNDPNGDLYHSMRNFIRNMHIGYLDSRGRKLRLPYRVSEKTVRTARKIGRRNA